MICKKAELIHADFFEKRLEQTQKAKCSKLAMVGLIIFRTVRHGEEASADTDAANDLVTEFVSIEEQIKVQTATDQIIRDMISELNSRTIKMADAQERCLAKGFNPDQFEELDIWQINQSRTKVTFI
ncbi:hypothetical protein CEXT_685551 [Caerostris extrusa]|uniref:Uncharacterized protein n=1 Tax=Caerostris extrusa TaxID=172846 RepID=A0AAV4T4B5_CAEEX|nr:hypothetical protein CEXT_685551 [Caerostris extrusa]